MPQKGADVVGSVPSGDVDLWLQFEQAQVPLLENELLHFWLARILV